MLGLLTRVAAFGIAAMCAFLMIKGAGAFSVDRKMSLAGRS